MRDLVEDGDKEGGQGNADDGGNESEAVLLWSEGVSHGKDGGHDDKPGEEDGEVEEEGEGD